MMLRVPGGEIAYDDDGSGLPVVFLHAFPLDRTMWAAQTGGLGDRCRCIAPDLRGLGASTAGPPFTMDRFADDVVALLDELAIERAVITGLSLGGYIAMALWRRHRDRVRALILANTRASADTDEGRVRRHELIDLARLEGSAAVADVQVTGLIGKSTRDRCPEVVEFVRNTIARAPVDGIIGGLEAMLARPDSTPLLPTISVPTLLIAGDEDVVTPAKEMRAMTAAIRGARMETITGAGHLTAVERPAAFNAVTAEFLAALSS